MSWSKSKLSLIQWNKTSLPASHLRSAAWPCVCCEVFAPPTLELTAGLRYALVTLSAPKASLVGCKTFSASARRLGSKCLGKALGSPVLVAVSSWRVKFLVTFSISKVGHFTHYAHLSLHFALFAYCLSFVQNSFSLVSVLYSYLRYKSWGLYKPIISNVPLIAQFVVIMYIKTYIIGYRAL